MKKIFNFLTRTSLILLFLSVFAHVNADVKEGILRMEAAIPQGMKDWKAPGLAIVIVKDGKIIYEKGFGITDIEKNKPVDENTVFQLSSVTKNFTATLMMKLVEEGYFKLDDKVVQYLPDLKLGSEDHTKSLTIRDILTQASGFDGFAGDSFWDLDWTREKIYQSFQYLSQKDPVGKVYNYSNMMFGLCGLIAEKVTGKTFGTLLEEYLFKPLDLTSATSNLDVFHQNNSWVQKMKALVGLSQEANIAYPHDGAPSGAVRTPINQMFARFPATSGINISAHDLGKWLLFHLQNTQIGQTPFLTQETLTTMHTSRVFAPQSNNGRQFPESRIHKVGYGIGWFVFDYGQGNKRINVLGHMGGITGTRGLITIIPELNLGIGIISNIGGMRTNLQPEEIRNAFLDGVLDLEIFDWHTDIFGGREQYLSDRREKREKERLKNPSPIAALNSYVGEYENAAYGKLRVFEKDKHLCIQLNDGPEVELRHWNGQDFVFDMRLLGPGWCYGDESTLRFSNESPKATRLMITYLNEVKDPIFNRVKS